MITQTKTKKFYFHHSMFWIGIMSGCWILDIPIYYKFLIIFVSVMIIYRGIIYYINHRSDYDNSD